jgi:hypothetical protein
VEGRYTENHLVGKRNDEGHIDERRYKNDLRDKNYLKSRNE